MPRRKNKNRHWLYRVIAEKKITQTSLARLANIHRTTIGNILALRVCPKLSTVQTIAQALGLDIPEIWEREEKQVYPNKKGVK